MFTGIVEELGRVLGVRRGAASATLTIAAHTVLADTQIGDSIAVNGVCLTVTGLSRTQFTADVMHETLLRSTLGGLQSGSIVNLERAMRADGRFGGHIVSGHIDGTGRIARIALDDNAVWYTVRTAPAVLRYVVEKGSIAVEGISLTVAAVDDETFRVSVIPHTQKSTTLSRKTTGDLLNLETDIVGKYVEKLCGGSQKAGGLTRAYLQEHGF